MRSYDEIEDMLPSLKIACLCYEYDRMDDFFASGTSEMSDDTMELYYDLICGCMDFFNESFNEYFEVNTLYFSDESMMEYYRLCKLYGAKHHCKMHCNPYVKEASSAMAEILYLPNSYGYGWSLQTNTKHQWCCGIAVRTDCEFNGELELLEAMMQTRDWYTDAVVRLRGELLKEGILHLPALPAHKKEENT